MLRTLVDYSRHFGSWLLMIGSKGMGLLKENFGGWLEKIRVDGFKDSKLSGRTVVKPDTIDKITSNENILKNDPEYTLLNAHNVTKKLEEDINTMILGDLNSFVYQDIAIERLRAHRLHYPKGKSQEFGRYYNTRRLPVLVEEVGEVARVLCDEPDNIEHLREELVQLGAMTATYIEAIDREISHQTPDNPA